MTAPQYQVPDGYLTSPGFLSRTLRRLHTAPIPDSVGHLLGSCHGYKRTNPHVRAVPRADVVRRSLPGPDGQGQGDRGARGDLRQGRPREVLGRLGRGQRDRVTAD